MRIAVVGAGLSGLAVARAIRQAAPAAAVRVFEAQKDASAATADANRRHGARLLLSSGTVAALEHLQIDYKESVERPLTYYDHAGSQPLCTVHAPFTDVNAIRDTLSRNATIQYDTLISNISEIVDDFDLVIGCDGRRSILRPLMDGIIEQPERNLGLSRITFDVPGDAFNATENHDLAFVGEGCLAMITRFAGRLRVSLAFPSNLGNDEPMETYRNITRFWLRPVNELVDHIDMDSVVKSEKLMDRDAPRLLSDNGKCALAGDALYCLSPFSGHAGGIALADAITIGHSVASDGHLLQYWQQIEKNSSSLVNDSRGKLAFMHSANVIEELKKLDSKRGTDQSSDSV